MRQRPSPQERQQQRTGQVRVQGLHLSRVLASGRPSASRALRLSGKTPGRAQLAAQHRAGHGRFAHDGGQTGRKKCNSLARPCRRWARKRPSGGNGKRSNSMRCGRSWVDGGITCGCVWSLSMPAGAWWLGCWADATRPRSSDCGRPYRDATGGIAGTSPTCSRPTWACCPAGSSAVAPRGTAARAPSKRSIVPCVNVAACSSESLVPLVNRWRCTANASKILSIITTSH